MQPWRLKIVALNLSNTVVSFNITNVFCRSSRAAMSARVWGSAPIPEPELRLSETVPELKKYIPDIKVYDELIVPGGLPL